VVANGKDRHRDDNPEGHYCGRDTCQNGDCIGGQLLQQPPGSVLWGGLPWLCHSFSDALLVDHFAFRVPWALPLR
jgi:hypothetical protein